MQSKCNAGVNKLALDNPTRECDHPDGSNIHVDSKKGHYLSNDMATKPTIMLTF